VLRCAAVHSYYYYTSTLTLVGVADGGGDDGGGLLVCKIVCESFTSLLAGAVSLGVLGWQLPGHLHPFYAHQNSLT
jgi:hypothetical protein